MKTFIVYKVSNLVNGKVYIGQTVRTLKARWNNHIWSAYNTDSKSLLHQAIRKYGKACFSIEIVVACASKQEMNRAEIAFIERFVSKTPTGYNLTNGGEGKHGTRWSDEQRAKRSRYRATKETNKKISDSLKGRPRPPEVKAKISATNTGKKASKETIEKMRKANLGKKLSEETKNKMRQRRHSDETKAKMSESHKGKRPTGEALENIRVAARRRSLSLKVG